MGKIEDCSDDLEFGKCENCSKQAEQKCNSCKEVFYCSRNCQKHHWNTHKSQCKKLLYEVKNSEILGKYLVATRELSEGEILWTEAPLVIGPSFDSLPICLNCYNIVNGSYKCQKSGWPLCGPRCEYMVSKNGEVIVPAETTAEFEIEHYDRPCYLYDSVTPLRVILLQKTSPKKFAKIMSMESHFEDRKNSKDQNSWNKAQNQVIDVSKKTLGMMVFEALIPEYDFSDEMFQRIYGILQTNGIEVRVTSTELTALYELTCLLEHSCDPNIKMTFDDKFRVTVKAGRVIEKGEHLQFMYTHSLWGTYSRRDHLRQSKYFWCHCLRCQDPTEYGSNISTLLREGKELLQKNPLDSQSPWSSFDGSIEIEAQTVKDEMSIISAELAILQLEGTVDTYTEFIKKYEDLLHPNHYHLLTAKHTLLQMLGRSEGYLIQDMDEKMLDYKIQLCNELIKVCDLLDPNNLRLQLYQGVALYELHLPILQIGKRKWEAGTLSTDDFRDSLVQPKEYLVKALDLFKEEKNANLPEGQMRIQVKETLTQLEKFMATLSYDDK